jgi:hypothetical protein
MFREPKRALLTVLAIALTFLPLVELVDHWESYGSDPEFVSVCTVLALAVGMLFICRRAILSCLRRIRPSGISISQSADPAEFFDAVILMILPRI